jgi:hypothetical protein
MGTLCGGPRGRSHPNEPGEDGGTGLPESECAPSAQPLDWLRTACHFTDYYAGRVWRKDGRLTGGFSRFPLSEGRERVRYFRVPDTPGVGYSGVSEIRAGPEGVPLRWDGEDGRPLSSSG